MTRVLASAALAGAVLVSLAPAAPVSAQYCPSVLSCPVVGHVCGMISTGCAPPELGCYRTPDFEICL